MIVEGRLNLLLGFLLVVGKRGEAGVAALTDAEQGIVRIHNVEIAFRHTVDWWCGSYYNFQAITAGSTIVTVFSSGTMMCLTLPMNYVG